MKEPQSLKAGKRGVRQHRGSRQGENLRTLYGAFKPKLISRARGKYLTEGEGEGI